MTPTFNKALAISSSSLGMALEVGVRHSMLQAYARARGKKPHEPDFVAAILVYGVPIFASHLNAICAGAGGAAKLTGIFCHGKPEVEHGGKGCELGDLLFAHFHTDSSGTVRRNSLLLQVKMSNSPIHTVSAGEQTQLQLYSSWPRFSYKRTSATLNGEYRDVQPKTHHLGAQYLLLDEGAPSDPATGLIGTTSATPALIAPPNPRLVANTPLSAALVEMLMGVNGRTFSDRSSAYAPKQGWSAVIWDLIGYGSTHAFTRAKRAGLVKSPREVTAFQLLQPSFFVRSGDSNLQSSFLDSLYGENTGKILDRWLDDGAREPPPYQLDIPDADGEGGIGVVVIETSDAPLDPRG